MGTNEDKNVDMDAIMAAAFALRPLPARKPRSKKATRPKKKSRPKKDGHK